ncbi:MAG: hypothetical protein Ct9H90mP16_00200 [Candidatus Poseidoniales archaeon]|nr:MAG: hypothetical protein Ct9H90mP16_00200 [Candidatus Poseidoniales archaeon]
MAAFILNPKVKVANASEAKSRGATAVSGQINLGDEQEPQMLIDMGAPHN